jgi:hypothetical protein
VKFDLKKQLLKGLTMITIISKDALRVLFLQIKKPSMWAERFLPVEIEALAGQDFEPQGLALALLSASKKSLQKAYSADKSMGSLEGMSLVGNALPKYIKALTPDENIAQEVIKWTEQQLFTVV